MLALALVLWWVLSGERQAHTRIIGGVQEIAVVVDSRYRPSTIVAWRGIPLRLLFLRKDDQPCSDRVIFSGFGVNRYLAPHRATEITLLPPHTGEFLFTCRMGIYRGKLIVREPPHAMLLSGRGRARDSEREVVQTAASARQGGPTPMASGTRRSARG